MRVLLAPCFTGGHLWGLKEGFRRIGGIEAEVLYFDQHYFNYPHDICLGISSEENRIKQYRKKLNI